MSRFQLVLQNPTIQQLCTKFPHLRRFRDQGFECVREDHRDNEVGLYSRFSGVSLRVGLISGQVTR